MKFYKNNCGPEFQKQYQKIKLKTLIKLFKKYLVEYSQVNGNNGIK